MAMLSAHSGSIRTVARSARFRWWTATPRWWQRGKGCIFITTSAVAAWGRVPPSRHLRFSPVTRSCECDLTHGAIPGGRQELASVRLHKVDFASLLAGRCRRLLRRLPGSPAGPHPARWARSALTENRPARRAGSYDRRRRLPHAPAVASACALLAWTRGHANEAALVLFLPPPRRSKPRAVLQTSTSKMARFYRTCRCRLAGLFMKSGYVLAGEKRLRGFGG